LAVWNGPTERRGVVSASPERQDRVQPAVTSSAKRILFGIIAVLSLAGVVVSAVSLQRHYAKSESNFCDFSQKFNCDIVNRSEYSTVVGVPVAAIGVVGYAALFLLSTFWRSRPETPIRLLGAAIAGLAFALYLTYIEAYELMTWCILCLSSLALISSIAVAAAVVKWKSADA
jgi:vitamin-K-epoxide reductase (warfarin-sensitive)